MDRVRPRPRIVSAELAKGGRVDAIEGITIERIGTGTQLMTRSHGGFPGSTGGGGTGRGGRSGLGDLKVDTITGEDTSTQSGTLTELSREETIGDLDAIVRAIVFSYFTPEEGSPTTGIIELELHVVETISHRSTGGIEETTLEVHGGGGGGGGGRQEEEGREKKESQQSESGYGLQHSAHFLLEARNKLYKRYCA